MELRKARIAAGLTQERLAARARISREYVSKLEHDRQSPTIAMLLRICEITGTRASKMIQRIEENKGRVTKAVGIGIRR